MQNDDYTSSTGGEQYDGITARLSVSLSVCHTMKGKLRNQLITESFTEQSVPHSSLRTSVIIDLLMGQGLRLYRGAKHGHVNFRRKSQCIPETMQNEDRNIVILGNANRKS